MNRRLGTGEIMLGVLLGAPVGGVGSAAACVGVLCLDGVELGTLRLTALFSECRSGASSAAAGVILCSRHRVGERVSVLRGARCIVRQPGPSPSIRYTQSNTR